MKISENRDFLQLCKRHLDIEPSAFQEIDNCLLENSVPQRYFWLNRYLINHLELDSFICTLPVRVVKVPWINDGRFDVYCIDDGNVRLSEWSQYKKHQLMGIDVASVLAVQELNLQPQDHVLDLCCSPGTKMILMASLVREGAGSVTGVDISEKRLFTCRSLLKQYKSYNVRLFQHDGCSFDVSPPHSVDPKDYHHLTNDNNQKKPLYALPKCLRQIVVDTSSQLYDKVLVDAECTHDGSVSHLLKHGSRLDEWAREYLTKERIDSVCKLQLQLLANGFRNLKPGGTLVYSTCSLSPLQNEMIIEQFLSSTPDALLAKIQFNDQATDDDETYMKQFTGTYITMKDGSRWWTSGFFMAKIQKKT